MIHNRDRARVSRRTFLAGMTAAGAGLAVEWIAAAESGRSTAGLIPVGVAKVDVTPDYPVRLAGYAGRKTESEGILQRLWAKALAIGGDDGDGPAVMLTMDNCGVPENVTEEVAARLKAKAGIKRERVVICSSHTHTAPWLEGFLPLHYVEPIPRDHQDRIRRYTRQATDWLEQAALQAISSRTPGRLAWAQGRVGFAANRRVLAAGRSPNASASAKRLGYHAQRMLEHIRRDGRVPAKLGYHVTTCTFGRELAMVFLPGEVVIDYALRLKRELDADRLWVTAYVNDVPCYIPSKRILKEGGYEADSSMISYAQPTRFAPTVEDQIVATAKSLLPEAFQSRATERPD